MLASLLTKDTIQIQNNTNLNWKEAIRQAASPLLEAGKVEESYVDSMIDVVEKNGPFINIGPHIALAHSRPEKGVNEMGMALMKVTPAINLVSVDHPITLFFVLAASDNTKHLKALQELATILQDDRRLKRLENAESVNDLVNEFKGVQE
ncbi:PTS sugar transporter subunit IIA [Levilactobacillus namurensis]|uniref:PTS sugar transporter subunit IIA n=1 Tax=Levilactobacillus namurensis TaxID=380393 RepID=UPI0026EB149C|nr:PTS sugar transporter subunit IIA [Levilactobacillus namurensis]